MKKILLVFSMFIIIGQMQAQGIRVGIKGGGNSTWLTNQNGFDTDESLDYVVTFGGTVGASATYMFTDMLGVSLDIMYASVNQKYKGKVKNTEIPYTIGEKLRYIDIPLLFKLTSKNGPYLEIGPKLSLLTSHVEDYEYIQEVGPFVYDASYSRSYKNDFNSLVFSVALGFGVDIKVAKNMFVTAGLRLAYGPGDVMKKKEDKEIQDAYALALITGESEISQIQGYSSYKDGDFSGADREYKYAKTHMATGGLILGFTYEFGLKK